MFAISNATSEGSPSQFQYFVQQGMLQALGKMLVNQDAKTLSIVLEGISNILEAGK